jgi:hypothetical protein
MKLRFAKKWKWAAMDSAGEWYLFTHKPVLTAGTWCHDDRYENSEDYFIPKDVFEPAKDWRKSLIRINK